VSEERFDWRAAVAEIGTLLRELENARAELAVGHEINADLRARLRRAEEAWSTYAARTRAERQQVEGVDPARLADVTIMFGTDADEAVRVPTGPGNAQFLYGLIEILLRDSRPIFFQVERRREAELRAVQQSAEAVT
jgi:hypothetical protein